MSDLSALRIVKAPPSMKVPPKRKGNHAVNGDTHAPIDALNESPSEKEGKSARSRL